MYTVYEYLAFFLIYSFLGWCAEVVFNTVNTGQFVNRGFLNGPVCPIYGFGMVVVIVCLTPVQEHFLLLFAGSVLLTSLVELAGGYLLEKAFQTRWWDYSEFPYNIGGYVCLKFSLLWGLGCTAVFRGVQPLVAGLVRWVPLTALKIIIAVLFLVLLADFIVTVASVIRFNRNLGYLDELSRMMRQVSDEIGEGLAGPALRVAQKGEEIKATSEQVVMDTKRKAEALLAILQNRKEQVFDLSNQKKREIQTSLDEKKARLMSLIDEYERTAAEKKPDRLFKAFPKVRSVKYNNELRLIKERLAESWHKKRG